MEDHNRSQELKREVDRDIRDHNRIAGLDRMNASAALQTKAAGQPQCRGRVGGNGFSLTA